MRPERNNMVAVVAIGGEPSKSLRQMCREHHWLCLASDEVLYALKVVRRHRMLVVVVEVVPADGRSTELLKLLSREASETTIVAVVPHHEDRVERDIRAAGASWYVPTVNKTVLIERIVTSILEQHGTRPSAKARSCPTQGNDRVFSSSPPPINYGRRARECPSPPWTGAERE